MRVARFRWSTLGRWALYGTLSLWFGLSVTQQTGRPHPLAKRIDPTAMAIPNWRFFAPTPARHDFNVLYRDRLRNGELTPWREQEITKDRTLRQMLWHPDRRMEKALFDVASELLQSREQIQEAERIQLTVPYLAMLNFVSYQVEHHPDAVAVQFLIAQSAGHDESVEPTMLFLSEFHSLAAHPDEARREPAWATA
ncbi:hypothetical protein [Saccharomonospora glauca]|jgi:hypothetical protein|uniref:Uncharacterized protein n=1 Tax=Saccharomonospora glauca K62 TaxID=928724 RepID=I1D0R6_9PSEU|nr:hypothetical protein [Saccharomonospora glauca]EIE98540.1 hypothetical protein SacglDRAFT_01625 [Saccharomonospora glauca K62]